MRLLHYLLFGLVALGLAALGLYLLWLVVSFIYTWIIDQHLQTVAAIVTLAGTIVVCVFALIISQQIAKARDIAESRRPEKTEFYTEFVITMVGLMRKREGSGATVFNDSDKFEDFITNSTTEVIMWGSPDVLNKYAVLSQNLETPGPDPVLLMDDLIQAMRKDVGLSTWSLARGELIKIFLSDPEKVKEFLIK